MLVKEDTISARRVYPKALVLEVFKNSDGLVRRALIRTPTGEKYMRDVRKLSLLEASPGIMYRNKGIRLGMFCFLILLGLAWFYFMFVLIYYIAII